MVNHQWPLSWWLCSKVIEHSWLERSRLLVSAYSRWIPPDHRRRDWVSKKRSFPKANWKICRIAIGGSPFVFVQPVTQGNPGTVRNNTLKQGGWFVSWSEILKRSTDEVSGFKYASQCCDFQKAHLYWFRSQTWSEPTNLQYWCLKELTLLRTRNDFSLTGSGV